MVIRKASPNAKTNHIMRRTEKTVPVLVLLLTLHDPQKLWMIIRSQSEANIRLTQWLHNAAIPGEKCSCVSWQLRHLLLHLLVITLLSASRRCLSNINGANYITRSRWRHVCSPQYHSASKPHPRSHVRSQCKHNPSKSTNKRTRTHWSVLFWRLRSHLK